MEAFKIPALLLLLSILSPAYTQNYFAGLNLDPTLISQTNIAINTLKNSLYLNFDCNPAQFQALPFGASSPSTSPLSFMHSYQNYTLQGLSGFNGGF